MNIIKSVQEAISWCKEKRRSGARIGFVPTMGALHPGHISLVKAALAANDLVVVSIFVNPIQFNNPDDLKNYPKTLDKDLKMLMDEHCDMVFLPSVSEMYPAEISESFDFGHLEKVMEGAYRPGHFNGVALVVKRLFEIIKPHTAYFGLKDYQQLMIIKALVHQLKLDVEIIPCPIYRETDGLAMSSRNMRLNATERTAAPFIYKTLKAVKEKSQFMNLNQLEAYVTEEFLSQELMKLEYFVISDANSLEACLPSQSLKGCIACVAVYVGNIRLIDNIIL